MRQSAKALADRVSVSTQTQIYRCKANYTKEKNAKRLTD
jgi:hypothetical protein